MEAGASPKIGAAEFARKGAETVNAKRTPAQRTTIARKGSKALWKGHIKKKRRGDKNVCKCRACSMRRKKSHA